MELGCDLPSDYSQFLRRFNGGVPTPNAIWLKRDDPIEIEHFYSLVPPDTLQRNAELHAVNLLSITRSFRNDLDLPDRYLPVAVLQQTHDIVLLAISGKTTGKVYRWSFIESGFDSSNVKPLARSFDELLRQLDQQVPEKPGSSKQLFQKLDDALVEGDLEAIRALIPQLDLSKAPRDFVPPAHSAVLTASSQVMDLLQQLGVDCSAKWDGKTPLKEARERIAQEKSVLEYGPMLGLPEADLEKSRSKIAELNKIVKLLNRRRIQ